jgi:hypothetical protein
MVGAEMMEKLPGLIPYTLVLSDDSTLIRQASDGLLGIITSSVPSLAMLEASVMG